MKNDIQKVVEIAATFMQSKIAGTAKAVMNINSIIAVAVGIISLVVVIIAILVSLPGMIMQSALPENVLAEEGKTLILFADTELSEAEQEKKDFISWLISLLSTEEETAEMVGDEPTQEEIMIIYSVKYGGYFDPNKIDKQRIRQITDTFFERHILKIVVRPFEEALNLNGLTKEQKTIAMNMYEQYMYNQDSMLSEGDFIQDFGNVTFKDGETEVVYYSQRDERWGGEKYGDSYIWKAACGPTCLAMVVSSFTNKTITPDEMSKWAYEHGYKAAGGGSYWSLIPEGGAAFGLTVEGNITEAQQIVDALANGKLIIVIVGKKPFTSSGHFIVLRGVTSAGKILIADPYSINFTNQEWDLNVIVDAAKKGRAAGGPFWILSN